MTNCMNVPVEALEMEAPLRVHSMRLAADSGGPGRQRGGLGCVQEFEMLVDDVAVTYRGERHFSRRPASRAAGRADSRRRSSIVPTEPSSGSLPRSSPG